MKLNVDKIRSSSLHYGEVGEMEDGSSSIS